MRGGFVVESTQHTGASFCCKVQAYPELTFFYVSGLQDVFPCQAVPGRMPLV